MSLPIDYGPLAGLAGTWRGDHGRDISPTSEGSKECLYFETLVFEECGEVTNAGTQTLAVLRYHQIVSRKSDREVFHNESGYLAWDAAEKLVVQSLAIPRGVSVVAVGNCSDPDSSTFEVRTNGPGGQIAQTPFMQRTTRTLAFAHRISRTGDQLTYSQTTTLESQGRVFEHTDQNHLTRI